MRIIICIGLILIAATAAFSAKIYFWTDDKGVKHISQQPPPEGVQADETGYARKPQTRSTDLEADQFERRQKAALDRLEERQRHDEAEKEANASRARARAAEDEYRKKIEQKETDRARRIHEDVVSRKEELQDDYNNVRTEQSRRDLKRRLEKVEQSERILREGGN